jgi:hypothetical protein
MLLRKCDRLVNRAPRAPLPPYGKNLPAGGGGEVEESEPSVWGSPEVMGGKLPGITELPPGRVPPAKQVGGGGPLGKTLREPRSQTPRYGGPLRPEVDRVTYCNMY